MNNNIRLISWNSAGRRVKNQNQQAALRDRNPDLIALQEVTRSTVTLFRQKFTSLGFEVADTFERAVAPEKLVGHRRHGLLVASRWPIEVLPPADFDIPWLERVLSVKVRSPYATIELHNVHVPCGASNGMVKIETFEGIYQRLARQDENTCRILCGDFNSPQKELEDGTLITWGQRELADGSYRITDGNRRWDAGERMVLEGLRVGNYDFKDSYRSVHGYYSTFAQTEAEDEDNVPFSWYWQGKGRQIGRRYDHIFTSNNLTLSECRYLNSFRKAGLSDHAPIELIFAPLSCDNDNITSQALTVTKAK